MNIREAILDALADDCESIVQIIEYLNYLGLTPTQIEIVDVLNKLYEQNKIEVVYPQDKLYKEFELSDELKDIWFSMTESGREEWQRIKV